MKALVAKFVGRAGPYVMDDIATVMNSLGHKTMYFDWKKFSHLSGAEKTLAMIDEAKKTLCEFSPDFIIGYGATNFFKFNVGGVAKIDMFNSLGIPSASVYYDSPMDPRVFDGTHELFASKQCYNFVWDRHYTEEMIKLGFERSYYMPIGANTKRFKKLEYNASDAEKYSADVSFVGSHTIKRELVLGRLLDCGFDFKIWGYEWDRATDKRFAPLIHGVADNELELVKVYNYSKVNVNITVDQGISSLNMRVFDCMASGGFLISDYKEDFDRLFDAANETVTYRKASELPGLVRYYLDNDEKRKEISKKARRRVLAEHSYMNRVNFILETLEREGAFTGPRWQNAVGDPSRAISEMVEMIQKYNPIESSKIEQAEEMVTAKRECALDKMEAVS
jgi:hypothetical protein